MNQIRIVHATPRQAPADLATVLQREGSPGAVFILEEGIYRLPWPLRLGPEWSGTEFRAASKGKVIFDGGFEIGGWREEMRDDGERVWAADVSELVATHGPVEFLLINGEQRGRCRYPESGEASGEKTESRVVCALPEVLSRSAAFCEWELVLHYDWVCRRLRVSGVDPEGIDFIPDGTSRGKETLFHIENVPLELLSPGHWKCSGKTVYYRPLKGESLDDLEAAVAVAPQLLEICGDPGSGRSVEGLVFNGIEFRRTGDSRLLNSNQADWRCSAAVTLSGALNCRFEHCTFTDTSGWGLAFEEGSRGNTVESCRFESLGAGGIKANGAIDPNSPDATGNNRIIGNVFLHGGLRWAGAVGILLRNTAGNEVCRNEIAHFRYSGISCGWTWGYGESAARGNLIEENHIHHLGQDHLLVDLGGIYTLGVQPGTIIRGNIIHDIAGKSISWGIYLDEGSSDIVVEENLVYRVASECFHLHYGRNNRVRNNVFAFGINGAASITRGTMDIQCRFTPGDKALIFEGNLFLSDSGPYYVKYILDYDIKEDFHCIDSDRNFFLHPTGKEPPPIAGDGYHCYLETFQVLFDGEAWQRLGFDTASLVCHALPESASDPVKALYSRLLNETAPAIPND